MSSLGLLAMLIWLLILFITVPPLELVVLIWLTHATSFGTTVLIVLSTGVIGAALARWQGFRAWNTIRADLTRGRPSTKSVVAGVLILIAGLLLLTPGLISDGVGFLLLIPPVRSIIGGWLIARLQARIKTHVRTFRTQESRSDGEIIDAEFRRADARSKGIETDAESNVERDGRSSGS